VTASSAPAERWAFSFPGSDGGLAKGGAIRGCDQSLSMACSTHVESKSLSLSVFSAPTLILFRLLLTDFPFFSPTALQGSFPLTGSCPVPRGFIDKHPPDSPAAFLFRLLSWTNAEELLTSFSLLGQLVSSGNSPSSARRRRP